MCMEKVHLAIFDLDGTLFDTGDVNYHAYKDALGLYGIKLDKDYFGAKCNGRHYMEFLPIIMGTYENLEQVHKAKTNAYPNNLDKARENTHLFEMIRLMRKSYHIAIVTTASRKNTLEILNYFGRNKLFDLIITQEDISNVKPDPEGFLKAMAYFGVNGARTVIFEDSDVGLQAARATGASVIAIDNF